MTRKIQFYFVLVLFVLSGCNSIYFVPHEENELARELDSLYAIGQIVYEGVGCEECFVVPYSGPCKDIKHGYFFNQKLGQCEPMTYSSGGIPPPFKTMAECVLCCANFKQKIISKDSISTEGNSEFKVYNKKTP